MGLIFQNLKTFKQAKNEALSPVNKQCYKIRKLNLIFSNKNNIKNKYWSRKPNLCIRLDHLHHNFRIEVYQICFFAWLSYPYYQSLIFNLDHNFFSLPYSQSTLVYQGLCNRDTCGARLISRTQRVSLSNLRNLLKPEI